MQTIQDAMQRGQINAALIIPPDFSEQMSASNGKPVLFVYPERLGEHPR